MAILARTRAADARAGHRARGSGSGRREDDLVSLGRRRRGRRGRINDQIWSFIRPLLVSTVAPSTFPVSSAAPRPQPLTLFYRCAAVHPGRRPGQCFSGPTHDFYALATRASPSARLRFDDHQPRGILFWRAGKRAPPRGAPAFPDSAPNPSLGRTACAIATNSP